MDETYYSLTDIVKLCDNLVASMPTSFFSGIWKVRNTLYQIPAADVVPVVRCGECEYNGHCFTQSLVRDEGIIPFDPDTWFCADGKRTDGKA